MKILIKDISGNKFVTYITCDKCRKLLRKFTYGGKRENLRDDPEKLKEDIKKQMIKADLNYCCHCGNKNFVNDSGTNKKIVNEDKNK